MNLFLSCLLFCCRLSLCMVFARFAILLCIHSLCCHIIYAYSRFRLLLGSSFKIRLEIGLDHRYLRSVNNLNTLTFLYNSDCTGCLKHLFINKIRIRNRTAQSRCTAVHGDNIFLATETSRNHHALLIRISICI